MKIDYIIPTLNRPSLQRTIQSIKEEETKYSIKANILICDTENCAAKNRNKSLEKVKDSDWILFVDDDDYLAHGHSLELDNNFDIVILTMEQEGKIKPDQKLIQNNTCIFQGNVGINFAIKTSFYLKYEYAFDNLGIGEDWRFLWRYLAYTKKIKITDKVYYHAPLSDHTKKNKMKFKNEKFNKQKFGLYIGTPLYGEQVNLAYMDSIILLSKELEKAGIPSIRQHVIHTSLITKARNECISNFMNNTKLDYFLFIDADIGFNALDVIKMMNYDKPLIAGTYPKKHLRWEEIQKCFYNDIPETSKELFEKTSEYTLYEKENEIPKDGLLEVNRVGTGFMMIKRDLIKKMAKKYPKLMYKENGKKGYGLFESAIMNKEHLSEDYAFCERVKGVGEKVLIDPAIELTHNGGNIKFYGKYSQTLK